MVSGGYRALSHDLEDGKKVHKGAVADRSKEAKRDRGR